MVEESTEQNTDLDDIEDFSTEDSSTEHKRLRPLASFMEFDLSHRPTQAKDRVSTKKVYIGIALGLILIALGLITKFDLMDDTFGLQKAEKTIAPSFFSASWLFVGLGLFLIVTRITMLFYGRDFFIGHKFAAIIYQKPFEHNLRIADSLDAYLGVRYRTRIVNVMGLTSFTQHIIDLQHPNEKKTIPLYITANGENISGKWRELAQYLKKPALFNTAEGIIEIAPEDILKPLPQQIAEGKVDISTKNLYKIPPSFKIVEDAKNCQIDPQIRDSAFSVFSALCCFFTFFAVLFFGFLFYDHNMSYIPTAFSALVLFVLIPVSLFFRRKRVIVSQNGIKIKSRWYLFPSFGFLIEPDKIEYIYVIHNSYDLKYSLVIGADGQTAHIGRGLPKEDLEWLQNFINAQIKRFICTKKDV